MRLCCLWIRKDFGFEILILLIHNLIAIKEHYAILGNSNCSAKKISFLEVLMLIWIHFGNKCQLRKNRLAESALWMEPLGKQTSAVTQSRRTVAKRGLASQDRGDLPCPKLVVGLTHSDYLHCSHTVSTNGQHAELLLPHNASASPLPGYFNLPHGVPSLKSTSFPSFSFETRGRSCKCLYIWLHFSRPLLNSWRPITSLLIS